MVDKEIRITISAATGEPTVETFGFVGKECVNASKSMVDALMGDSAKQTLKPEYHQIQTSQNEQERQR